MAHLRSRLTSHEGATAVEYGVMVAAVIAVIAAIVFAIGTTTNSSYASFNTEFSSQN